MHQRRFTQIAFGDLPPCAASFRLLGPCPSSSKVTKIGDMVFDNCKSMKSITLPKKVTMICDESFHWCDKLRTIKLLGKKHPKLKSYCVFTTDTIFAKKRTKNITFKCPNMSKKEKKKFRK